MNTAWFTVASSKVIRIFVQNRTNSNGENRKGGRITTGIRINMMDGGWWFHSFMHNSWTKHHPSRPETDMFGNPKMEGGKPVLKPATIENYSSWEKVLKEWGARKPELIQNLLSAVDAANNDDEAPKSKEKPAKPVPAFPVGMTVRINTDAYGQRYKGRSATVVGDGEEKGTIVLNNNRRKNPMIVKIDHVDKVA